MKPLGNLRLRGAALPALAALLSVGLLGAPGLFRQTAPAPRTPGPASVPAAPALPGERETLALAQAYPDRILGREIRSGEWSVRIGDRWFYWAGGRMLPAEDLPRRDEYVPIRFYAYYRGPRRRPEPSPEQVEALRARGRSGNADPRPRSDAFLDGLYGFSSAEGAERALVEVSFLGRRVRVHPLLAGPLSRAELAVRAAQAADPELDAFVRGLAQIQGFYWRPIAGTERRSYHGYGAAVDVVPRSYGGRFAYWRWAADAGVADWWALPEGKIWPVPRAFVDAMEAQGFVWGGKWLWFDTVHFEYRPEVLRLAE